MAERVLHCPVQAIAHGHLVRIGAALIPEPLNVHDDDRPVNGQPLVLYLPHPAIRQKPSSTTSAQPWVTLPLSLESARP
jgi:hypothetical protein